MGIMYRLHMQWPFTLVVVGAFFITSALSCDQAGYADYEPDPESIPETAIIELTRKNPDVPLSKSGLHQDTLVAQIPKDASMKVVTFTTTLGMFIPYRDNPRKVTVRAREASDKHDDRLVAEIVLVAGVDTNATAFVAASVSEYTHSIQVSFSKSSSQ